MNMLYGVIGDPIAHSMSPLMHNAVFSEHKLNAYYHPFHIKKDDLVRSLLGMKALGIAGFNVTIPHKELILPLLDEVDPLAQAIGAVNTVVSDGEKLIGYNTDGEGFMTALHHKIECVDSVLVIGAGGAAKAILYTLAHQGIYSIDVANRTVANGERLLSECPFPIRGNSCSLLEAEEKLAHYDVVIQTTNIGMHPHIQDSPLSVKNLKASSYVIDIIYNPQETLFLKEAKELGARTQNGLGMFVHQGALAFQKWTGIYPDTKIMKKIVMKQLGGNNHANR
ncbi:shikimate dehydrogenase [Bacillus sp. 2205SS5-2]|uniref:shikimate dehydrogenase n=1 Tax=Bacillus sp. 2205SS5-2 TaxID=3109031 RepID=UPI00300617FC